MRRSNTFELAAGLLILILVLAATAQGATQKYKPHKHKEKRFEAVVRAEARDYAGRYVGIDESYVLEVSAEPDGSLKITSHEGARRATLRDIRLDGARLNATKVYEDGSTDKFEGLFADRVLNGERRFGVLVSGLDIPFDGMTLNRIFYSLFTETR